MLISKRYLQMNARQFKRNKMMVTIVKIDGDKNVASGLKFALQFAQLRT